MSSVVRIHPSPPFDSQSEVTMNPDISVIVPVHNSAQYLGECLTSIQRQTFQNIEIICVNDGSNDNSGQILKEYAQKDNRIKIIYHKNNKGLACSRNTGLDNATGDYIFFLDSDDYLIKDCIENLYNNIIRTKSDIVVTRAEAFANDNSEETVKRTENMNNWLNKYCEDNYQVDIYNFANTIDNHNCVSWGKLYTKSFLINNNFEGNWKFQNKDNRRETQKEQLEKEEKEENLNEDFPEIDKEKLQNNDEIKQEEEHSEISALKFEEIKVPQGKFFIEFSANKNRITPKTLFINKIYEG